MRLPIEMLVAAVVLASCAVVPPPRTSTAPHQSSRVGDASKSTVRVGAPYRVGNATYTPRDDRDYEQVGEASWYGEEMRGRRTANGEQFDPDGISAAHRTLPLPSYVEVTALDNGRTVLVRVNDRGPFHSNRIIDLSLGAARQLGFSGGGARRVGVRRVDPSERDRLVFRDRRGGRETGPIAALAPAEVPGAKGPFFLQIASFQSKDRARDLADRLDAQVTLARGIWRVRLGPYETADKASAALVPLAARGYPDAIITR